MFKKYQLTDTYWLQVCNKEDDGALNGFHFTPDGDWVIREDLGDKVATRYMYSTIAAKKFNFHLKAETPKGAIQQVLSYAYTGQENRLKEMYFIIIKYNI